uniref:Putative ovule protein n=1 Tax=Solanum chacoense TaxID=4108 RepID=A0A0V0GSD2_SOLCH
MDISLSRLGDGSRISLRTHKWCKEIELKEAFPNLYRESGQREMTIQLICRSHEGVIHCDLRFKRNLNHCEMKEFHN